MDDGFDPSRIPPPGMLPSAYMRQARPDQYSDSEVRSAFKLDEPALEQRLDALTARNQTHDFEIFCRKLCERVICPNLKPNTGPEGGGDSKADTETIAVADEIATLTYVGTPNAGRERWAFAFSAKKNWSQKAQADIEGLAATGRSYDKVFFVTSRYARARDRARIEDELSSKHGFRVEILDRSWIVEKVIAGDQRDLAFDYLGVGERVESSRKGPADYARSLQLEDLEKALRDPEAYAGMEGQRATDALLAAKLSRELERPRFETDGRFERAIRLADSVALISQKLEARYERLWTAFYWFDDIDLLDSAFDDFADMALPSPAARHVEFASNLLQSLVNAVVHGHRTVDQLKLKQRSARVIKRLEQLAAETERPNNALEARTTLVAIRAGIAVMNREPEALSQLWQGLTEILSMADGLAEYQAAGLVRLIKIFGPIAGRDPAYSALVDNLASFVSRRVGEGESGRILLERARQLDIEEDRLEVIRLLGWAIRRLAKKEYVESLVEATYLLAVAYRGAGLLWAARANALFATASIIAEAETDTHPPAFLVPALILLGWIDLELRLMPELLDVIRLLRGCRRLLPLTEASQKKLDQDLEHFDIVLAGQLTNLSLTDLEALCGLPDSLEGLGLTISEAALLYALGYEKVLSGDSPDGKGTEGKLGELLSELAKQLPSDFDARPFIRNDNCTQSIETRVLGMRVVAHIAGSDTSILVAQTVLAVVETLFATTLGSRIGALVERFDLTIEECEHLDEPAHNFDEMRMHATLRWPKGMSPASFERRSPIHRSLTTLASAILAATCSPPNPLELIEKLFRDEALAERLSTAIASANSHSRGFNSEVARLSEWTAMARTHYPPMPDRPRIPRDKVASRPAGESIKGTSPPPAAPTDHRRMEVHSILDPPLWHKAGWSGLLLGVHEPGRPPIIGFLFDSREVGCEIFRRWRERFGEQDLEGAIHLAILRDLPGHPPRHYAALLTAGRASQSDAQLVTITARLKILEPETDNNLRRFLDAYRHSQHYWLAPAVHDAAGTPELIVDLAILKRDLPVKRIQDISEQELEFIGCQLLASEGR